jgi:hypothetical protein
MGNNDIIIDRIGKRLRDASSDMLEEQLPEEWRRLVSRLGEADQASQPRERQRWPRMLAQK